MYPIPANATRIRYLESTGTQYIDTGISYFADFEIGIKLAANVANKTIGVSATSCLQRRSSGNPTWQFLSDGSYYSSTALITDYHLVRWSQNQIWIDGAFVAAHNKAATAGRLTIARVGTTNYSGVMVYSAKIWDNGVLVRSFVPVRVGQVGYLFDRVSGQLFGNSGTGDFVCGPDTFATGVLPTRMCVMGVRKKPYDAEVEYVESTGTQYIDTGVVASTSQRFECDWEPTSASGSSALAGTVTTVSNTAESNRFQIILGQARIGFGIGSGFLSAGATTAPAWTVGVRNRSIVDAAHLAAYNNGTQLQPSSGTYSANVAEKNIYVFSVNGKVSTRANASVRVYSFSIYDNGVLVRSYVPVRVGTAGYLYDRANPNGGPLGNGLYGSATSTPLVAGPDKSA